MIIFFRFLVVLIAAVFGNRTESVKLSGTAFFFITFFLSNTVYIIILHTIVGDETLQAKISRYILYNNNKK